MTKEEIRFFENKFLRDLAYRVALRHGNMYREVYKKKSEEFLSEPMRTVLLSAIGIKTPVL